VTLLEIEDVSLGARKRSTAKKKDAADEAEDSASAES
jgi:hypothetical protein